MTTDGNTHAINHHLNDREDWDELLKALKNSVYLAFDDGTNDYTTALKAADRIEELEAELEIALEGLKKSQQEIDDYIRQDYPQDIPLHERYRMRDFSANPARTTLAEMKGEKE